MPERIQRSRARGSRLPPGAVCVTRGTRWGNPFRVVHRATGWEVRYSLGPGDDEFLRGFRDETWARAVAVGMFEAALLDGELLYTVDTVRELAGATLACWCPIGAPCHGDVLLRIANDRPAPGPPGGP